MTPQPLPKPSQVLRPYITDPDPHWVYGAWQDLARPAPGEPATIPCRCQAQILLDYAVAAGRAKTFPIGSDSFVCAMYNIPMAVFSAAMHANDQLDVEDYLAADEDAGYETITRLNALAPKYLARVIAVYEEAGL